jgi:hypothetical protein
MRLIFALLLCLPALASANQGFNPDLSVNFLGLYQHSTLNKTFDGPRLQEAEVQFLSDVDPYFRANVMLSVSADAPPFTDFGIDPEEVYVETIGLPVVTLKMGKFKAAIGKNNNLHTHAFPFVDAPLFVQDILGTEGFSGPGLSAAVLLPVDWYSEVTVQGLGVQGSPLFGGTSNPDALAGVAHLKNLFDLGESTTVEFGLTGLTAPNDVWPGKTAESWPNAVWGSDLTVKWRPVQGGKYHAFIWGNEYLESRDWPTPLEFAREMGAVSYFQWQFAERWWVQARSEYLEDGGANWRQSALLAFFPSEFSGFRIEYDHEDLLTGTDHRISGQMNFTIGAHPAHAY